MTDFRAKKKNTASHHSRGGIQVGRNLLLKPNAVLVQQPNVDHQYDSRIVTEWFFFCPDDLTDDVIAGASGTAKRFVHDAVDLISAGRGMNFVFGFAFEVFVAVLLFSFIRKHFKF